MYTLASLSNPTFTIHKLMSENSQLSHFFFYMDTLHCILLFTPPSICIHNLFYLILFIRINIGQRENIYDLY